MKLAIIDGRMDLNMEKKLIQDGFIVIRTIEHPNLQDPVKYHPDMQMSRIDCRTLVICPILYDYYYRVIKSVNNNINLVKGSTYLEENYPMNIAYNAVILNESIIHLSGYTDVMILDEIKKRKMNYLSVRQGYTKCSVMIMPDGHCVTGDDGIYKKMAKENLHIDKTEIKDIELKGYDYGFIGGCSSIGDEKLYITGRLKEHKYGIELENKLKSKNINVVELSDSPLKDYGTIIILGDNNESDSIK